ncbi:hypothetical protein WICPIJ_010058 [Wickerhamomyces pijperi]|uniref:Uncharacterized protein n=1 Tax=Wickerhamomyces pijperi TaxID=599730 RepID=A0A9P8PHD8_WICPI|nr:hypothetical protein WICPIJ_010058 [Wickerhamomyces pijperi]
MLTTPWIDIIGLTTTDPKLLSFLESKGLILDPSQIKKLSNSTLYYNIYNKGIAFCFVNDKLDSIDFYSIDPKFQTVDVSLLPFAEMLSRDSTGKDLVEKFGEPLEKGGGFSQKMDIWMRWERFQVEINDKSWETAKDSNWKSITVF